VRLALGNLLLWQSFRYEVRFNRARPGGGRSAVGGLSKSGLSRRVRPNRYDRELVVRGDNGNLARVSLAGKTLTTLTRMCRFNFRPTPVSPAGDRREWDQRARLDAR